MQAYLHNIKLRPGGEAPPGEPQMKAPTPVTSSLWTNLIAGSIAGSVAKTAVAPLDRIKIMAQVGKLEWNGMLHLHRQIADVMKNEGILSLWRGNGAMVLRVVPYAGIHYALHEALDNVLKADRERATVTGKFLAGAGAGAGATLCTYPLDVLRARMAIASGGGRPTLKQVASEMYRYQGGGFHSFFKGLLPTLLGIVPYSGITWMTYETLKEYADLMPDSMQRAGVTNKVACGMVAGLVGQSVTYPLDVVRRRMQVQASEEGLVVVVRDIMKRGGWKAFFRGLSLNWFKGPIATTISLNTFDFMKQYREQQ